MTHAQAEAQADDADEHTAYVRYCRPDGTKVKDNRNYVYEDQYKAAFEHSTLNMDLKRPQPTSLFSYPDAIIGGELDDVIPRDGRAVPPDDMTKTEFNRHILNTNIKLAIHRAAQGFSVNVPIELASIDMDRFNEANGLCELLLGEGEKLTVEEVTRRLSNFVLILLQSSYNRGNGSFRVTILFISLPCFLASLSTG